MQCSRSMLFAIDLDEEMYVCLAASQSAATAALRPAP